MKFSTHMQTTINSINNLKELVVVLERGIKCLDSSDKRVSVQDDISEIPSSVFTRNNA